MASLTETSIFIKKGVKILGLSILVIIILKIGISSWKAYTAKMNPKPPPPPTVEFGKLPRIKFPGNLNPQLTLRLETPTGGTPDLGDRTKIYLMPTYRSNFLALDEAKKIANNMDFVSKPKELTEIRYKWENNKFLPSTLEMNIITGAFILERSWQKDATILAEKQLSGKEQASVEAKRFLQQAGLFNKDFEQARSEVKYLKFDSGQYIKAISLSEADFVQVDLFRPKVEEKLVLPEDPEKGIVQLIFSGSKESKKRIVKVEYNYFPVDKDQSATYPIKLASQAWRELQTKQGYIANVGDNPTGIITIRNIYLAYYDSKTPQGFLLPIIVFEGDNGFYGYVQAIQNEWLEESIDGD